MTDRSLSDKALSILTFAAYHALLSGEEVKEVVIDDGKGHHADRAGLEELQAADLIEAVGERGRFSEAGAAMVLRLVEAIRSLGR